MREQQEQIQALRAENADLKARLEALEKLVSPKEALAQR